MRDVSSMFSSGGYEFFQFCSMLNYHAGFCHISIRKRRISLTTALHCTKSQSCGTLSRTYTNSLDSSTANNIVKHAKAMNQQSTLTYQKLEILLSLTISKSTPALVNDTSLSSNFQCLHNSSCQFIWIWDWLEYEVVSHRPKLTKKCVGLIYQDGQNVTKQLKHKYSEFSLESK